MNSVVTYPSAISRACSALDEAAVFREMPDGFIRIVVRIIKKINLSCLNSPIFASRSTLAEESGKSLETVGRAIKWLENHGLVHRTKKARAGLKGSSSPLIPTHALLEALQLVDSHTKIRQKLVEAHPAEVLSYPQAPVKTDGSISSSLNNLSENNPLQPGLFTKMSGVRIPSDMVWLVQKGLSAFGLLALMKLARQAHQKLSDIVAVTRDRLMSLDGRNLYAYLRALLGKDQDYSRQAQDNEQSHQAEQARQHLEHKAEELLGRRYASRDGRVHVTVETAGILSEIRDGIRFARPLTQRFLDAITAGRLVPVR